MESTPLVSIVITVFNNDNYITECLDSVCNQSYQAIEVIAVDDGSSDKSPEICDEYQQRYDFVTVIHKANEGVSIARNTGMDRAHGKYLSFVDGDDIIDRDYCRLLVDAAEEKNSDIVVCDYKTFGCNQPLASSFTPQIPEINAYKSELILRTLYREFGSHIKNSVVSAGVTWGKFYNLEFIKKIQSRFIPGLVRAQDTVFWLNTLIKTDQIVHLERPLYNYRLNELSVCGGSRYFSDSATPFGMLLAEYEKFINKYKLGFEYLQAYYCRVIEVIFWHWKHNYFNAKNKDNLMKRLDLFCKLLKSDPYKRAMKNVNTSLLSKRQKGLVIAYRLHIVCGFILTYRALELWKEKKK